MSIYPTLYQPSPVEDGIFHLQGVHIQEASLFTIKRACLFVWYKYCIYQDSELCIEYFNERSLRIAHRMELRHSGKVQFNQLMTAIWMVIVVTVHQFYDTKSDAKSDTYMHVYLSSHTLLHRLFVIIAALRLS